MVCTGYGNGGALAELCGVWAAVTYPAAQIRTIAYGAPVVCTPRLRVGAFHAPPWRCYTWPAATIPGSPTLATWLILQASFDV